MARVTASVTHELNNVLAVTNEVTGLLGDLLEDIDPADLPARSKLVKVHERLLAQVSRGQAVIKRLNGFVHTADNSAITFDLNAVLGNLIGLCGRPADMKKVKLAFQPSGEPINITGDPFLLQLAIFDTVMWLLESGRAGDTLAIETSGNTNQAKIELTGFRADREIAREEALSAIEQAVKEVFGRLEFSADDACGRLTIVLPAAASKTLEGIE